MIRSNDINIEPNFSSTKSTKNLTFQDALIALAVYASQPDPHDCEDDVNSIQSLAQNEPLFREDSKETRSRINKFVNFMSTEKSEAYADIATASLPQKLKKLAFRWAVELSLDEAGSLEKNQNQIDNLRIRLSISNHAANQLINKIKSKSH
jgi:hypothetical protein